MFQAVLFSIRAHRCFATCLQVVFEACVLFKQSIRRGVDSNLDISCRVRRLLRYLSQFLIEAPVIQWKLI